MFQNLLNKSAIFIARKNGIPKSFSLEERILRIIFHPMNIKKNGNIKSNSFKSPAGIDEVSVNRLNYTGLNFCKKHAKKIQNPSAERSYLGFALLRVEEILQLNASVVFSPKLLKHLNLTHADIKIGFTKKKGEELPTAYSFIVDELASAARFYPDPDPQHNDWTGEELY